MLSFLITFIAFHIFSIPSEIYISILKKKILNAFDVDDANRIRFKAKVTKISNAIIFAFLFFLSFCLVKPDGVDYADYFLNPQFGSGTTGLLAGIIYTLKEEFKADGIFDNNISWKTINNIPPNSILYLRGFANDVYSTKYYMDIKPLGVGFSEFHFVKAVYLPVIAVGMTKEIESPIGACRIYLNDSDWKEGVLYMMKRAARIVVLMDYRESCIWEIDQCANYLNKTIFIVDNVEKYNRIKEGLKMIDDLPELELPDKNVAILKKSTDRYDVNYINISRKKGYKEIGNLII